jgi:hypothetical protein
MSEADRQLNERIRTISRGVVYEILETEVWPIIAHAREEGTGESWKLHPLW